MTCKSVLSSSTSDENRPTAINYIVGYIYSSEPYSEVSTQFHSSSCDYRTGSIDDNISLVNQVFLRIMQYKNAFPAMLFSHPVV